MKQGIPCWLSGTGSTCQGRRCGFSPSSGKIPHVTEKISPWATATEPVLSSMGATATEAHVSLEPTLHSKRQLLREKPSHCSWRVAPAHCNNNPAQPKMNISKRCLKIRVTKTESYLYKRRQPGLQWELAISISFSQELIEQLIDRKAVGRKSVQSGLQLQKQPAWHDWHLRNTPASDHRYTFCSSGHGTFTKTDHILGHKASISTFKGIQVIHSIFSDHGDIKLEINNRKISGKFPSTLVTK